MNKVAIIGAGVSGLVSARKALQYGLEVVVFEQKDHIGGIWVYNEEPDERSSPIYARLRTNAPVQLMEYRDFEFKAKSGLCYPPHSDVLKYINDYADHFDLRKFIQFQSSVVDVARLTNEWRVRAINNAMLPNSSSPPVQQYLFDAVMVCNGHYTIPYVPDFPGQETFTGQIVHSRLYRRNTPFKGQRLLVVGNGISAVDIAAECSEVATEVTVSYRSKVAKYRPGVIIKPQIKHIEGDRVHFVDDTSIQVDSILLCTGYVNDVSLIDDSCCLKMHSGRVIEPLFKGMINIMQPFMCFIGYLQRTLIFPLVDMQAEFFVKHLAGRIQLPDRSTMLASLEEEKMLKEKTGVPASHYFYVEDTKEYCTSLSRLGDIKPLAPVLFKILERNRMLRSQPEKAFLKFEIIDDENFLCCEEK